jgi:hypothetical protein
MNILKACLSIVIVVSLIFFQIFFPFIAYTTFYSNMNNKMTLGIMYYFLSEQEGEIYDSLTRMKNIGIRVIKIPCEIDPYDYRSWINNKTMKFFQLIDYFNCFDICLIVYNVGEDKLKFFLQNYGKHIKYIQLLNEPEAMKSWAEGAFWMDEELMKQFFIYKNITDTYCPNATYYTNFSPGFFLRPNLVIEFSKYLDFVGFDPYTEAIYYLTPRYVELLHKLSGKDVIISEFGASNYDEQRQAKLIIDYLNLFKSMGIKQAWIWSWNDINNMGIKGRLAEQKVAEWVARNS